MTDELMPLTLAQLDFWEEFCFHPDHPVSTVSHYVTIDGPADAEALAQAITRTVAETDVFRLRFHETPDGMRQSIDPTYAPDLIRLDLRGEADPIAAAKDRMGQDFHALLDLRRDRLSAQMLIQTADHSFIWYNRGHHAILDGYSMLLLEQRCARLYRHLIGKGPEGEPFLPFRRFIEEDMAYPASAAFAKDRDYWAAQLPPRIHTPVLEKGGEDYGIKGFEQHVPLPSRIDDMIRQRSQQLGIGWPDLLVLIASVYLHDRFLFEGPALPVWMPYMSRMGSVSAAIPALAVNILPLVVTVEAGEGLDARLQRLAGDLRKLRRHGRYRVEQLAADRGIGAGHRFYFSPLVNVLPFDPPQFEGCDCTRHVLSSGPADGFNITFRSAGDGSGMSLFLESDPQTTDATTFARHCRDLAAFLVAALTPENGAVEPSELLDEPALPA